MMAADAQTKPLDPSEGSNEDTVKLLTPDGKLVEVKRSVVRDARSGGKVSNQEILKWTNSSKTKS